MAEYHVGVGLAGIYAGTLKKNGEEWINKSDVTNEAINCVMAYMYTEIKDGDKSIAYANKTRDGKYLRLKLEVADECPEWAKDVLEPKKCDTCRHEKSQWFNRCADCFDYELWEEKDDI